MELSQLVGKTIQSVFIEKTGISISVDGKRYDFKNNGVQVVYGVALGKVLDVKKIVDDMGTIYHIATESRSFNFRQG